MLIKAIRFPFLYRAVRRDLTMRYTLLLLALLSGHASVGGAGICRAQVLNDAVGPRSEAGGHGIDPYLDSSVQDFVETGYGYMKGRTREMLYGGLSGGDDYRDALGPAASFRVPLAFAAGITPFVPGLRKDVIKPEAGKVPSPSVFIKPSGLDERISALRDDMQAEKTEILARLNSFSSFEPTPEVAVEERDYAVRQAGTAGHLASAVPPVDSPGGGYFGSDYSFIELELKGRNYRKVVEKISSETGFIPEEEPLPGPAPGFKGNVVGGWIQRERAGLVYSHPLVARVRTGKDIKAVSSVLLTEVFVSILLPSGGDPKELLRRSLKKAEEAGFQWRKTVDLSYNRLADCGRNSSPALTVKVTGTVPIDSVRKLFKYPFVVRVESAGSFFPFSPYAPGEELSGRVKNTSTPRMLYNAGSAAFLFGFPVAIPLYNHLASDKTSDL